MEAVEKLSVSYCVNFFNLTGKCRPMRWGVLLLVLFFTGCTNGDIEKINGGIKNFTESMEIEGRSYEIVEVELLTSDGVTIRGSYYNKSEEDAPGVILLHMLSRHRGDWHDFARDLQVEGYGVLAIDLRGHGESDLDYTDFSPGDDFRAMVLDVAPAKEFLVKEGISSNKISIMGGSIGANVALNYAAGDKDIPAIVLLSPGFDYRGIETEDAMIAYGDRPVFLIASEGDAYCAETCEKLYSLATGEKRLKIYPEDAHGTWIITAQDSSRMIIEWLGEVT
jgi:dienelactone hydrolase